MAGLALTQAQWFYLGLLWVVAFALPAVWIGRRARADGDAAFVWVVLTLVGSVLGVAEYFHHRSILRRRARRADAAARREGANGDDGPSQP